MSNISITHAIRLKLRKRREDHIEALIRGPEQRESDRLIGRIREIDQLENEITALLKKENHTDE